MGYRDNGAYHSGRSRLVPLRCLELRLRWTKAEPPWAALATTSAGRRSSPAAVPASAKRSRSGSARRARPSSAPTCGRPRKTRGRRNRHARGSGTRAGEAAFVECDVMDGDAVPEDIAGAVLFLTGEDAGYVTGELLYVDGGWQAF
ncbi:hypothetical protein BRD03_11695 [Halobacteriales archaeon QS_9_68_17]|nr:MAG: hypothetical protein BRD03_11695 [Halobacteriales archaeon QS_9_68_17]